MTDSLFSREEVGDGETPTPDPDLARFLTGGKREQVAEHLRPKNAAERAEDASIAPADVASEITRRRFQVRTNLNRRSNNS